MRQVYRMALDGIPERTYLYAEGVVEIISDNTGLAGDGIILISTEPFSIRFGDGEWRETLTIEEDVARWTFAEGFAVLARVASMKKDHGDTQ